MGLGLGYIKTIDFYKRCALYIFHLSDSEVVVNELGKYSFEEIFFRQKRARSNLKIDSTIIKSMEKMMREANGYLLFKIGFKSFLQAKRLVKSNSFKGLSVVHLHDVGWVEGL